VFILVLYSVWLSVDSIFMELLDPILSDLNPAYTFSSPSLISSFKLFSHWSPKCVFSDFIVKQDNIRVLWKHFFRCVYIFIYFWGTVTAHSLNLSSHPRSSVKLYISVILDIYNSLITSWYCDGYAQSFARQQSVRQRACWLAVTWLQSRQSIGMLTAA
jgi:hypothetical protein